MSFHRTLWCLSTIGLCLLVISPGFSARTIKAGVAQEAAAEVYPDTADGLRQLLSDLLMNAKNSEEVKLSSRLGEMKIPDYESWFTRTFGQEQGRKLADLYGRTALAGEQEFQMLLAELSRQQGEISVEKLDAAKRYGSIPGTVDEYRANWKKTDASPGPAAQTIGFLYFVEGKFRLNGSVHDVRVVSTNKGGATVPAKLLNRIQPVYPNEAQVLHVQGLVSINILVHRDGTVTVENVGAGHPLLAPAAVEAVQQWRYAPATINGEPVEIETKIYVTFALSKQQGAEK